MNIIFSLQNQPQLLLVGNFIDILFIVRIFENKLFFLKYVAAKYKETHYHDPLNQGDGVEQPLSICFSKSCDKLFMVNNRLVHVWCTCGFIFMNLITRNLSRLYCSYWYVHAICKVIFLIPFNLHGIETSCLKNKQIQYANKTIHFYNIFSPINMVTRM